MDKINKIIKNDNKTDLKHDFMEACQDKEFKDYTEFMDSNKKFLNELKEYVLRQFPGCEVLGDNDNSITIVVDNLLVGVTTGREFEDVVMHITSKDNPSIEY